MITFQNVQAGLALGIVVGLFVAAIADTWARGLPRARACAWCRKVQAGGRLPATHGICPACFRKVAGD